MMSDDMTGQGRCERLRRTVKQRGGHDVRINWCPPEMVLTPEERHQATIRMRCRHERNIKATGETPHAY